MRNRRVIFGRYSTGRVNQNRVYQALASEVRLLIS